MVAAARGGCRRCSPASRWRSVAARLRARPAAAGLLVALVVARGRLVLDALADAGPRWAVEAARPSRPPGQDPRPAYLSLLESHVTARTPDGALRDRFAELADRGSSSATASAASDPPRPSCSARTWPPSSTGRPAG